MFTPVFASGQFSVHSQVEANLKSCQIVDNICAYADGKHNFTVAFVVPNPLVLSDIAKRLNKDPAESLEKLCKDQDVIKGVLDQIKVFGEKAGLSKYEVPVKIKLCHETWTPDSGLVTAALKIRRRPIQEFYHRDLQLMFS